MINNEQGAVQPPVDFVQRQKSRDLVSPSPAQDDAPEDSKHFLIDKKMVRIDECFVGQETGASMDCDLEPMAEEAFVATTVMHLLHRVLTFALRTDGLLTGVRYSGDVTGVDPIRLSQLFLEQLRVKEDGVSVSNQTPASADGIVIAKGRVELTFLFDGLCGKNPEAHNLRMNCDVNPLIIKPKPLT